MSKPAVTDLLPGLPFEKRAYAAWLNAKGWSVLYGGAPVYLVGSSLTSEDPRDVDVVVVLTNTDFKSRYGGTIAEWEFSEGWPHPHPIWLRWARDCAKRNRLHADAYKIPLDFKVQPLKVAAKYAAQRHKRLRLDCGGIDDRIPDSATSTRRHAMTTPETKDSTNNISIRPEASPPDPIERFFDVSMLGTDDQELADRFCALKTWIVQNLPRNPERTVALRKLLESRDCALRAALPAPPPFPPAPRAEDMMPRPLK